MPRLRSLLVDVEPLRRDREYRYLWSGQVLSAVGREVTRIALAYQVYVLTGSPLAIGALAIAELVPLLLFSLPSGAIADAVERRRLMILCQLALALTSLALAILATVPQPPLAALYAIAFVAAAVSTLDRPARVSSNPSAGPAGAVPGGSRAQPGGLPDGEPRRAGAGRRHHRDARPAGGLSPRFGQLQRRAGGAAADPATAAAR